MRLTIPKRFSAALLDAHSLIGVLFAWGLYLVCFSGSLAVLADEFTLWERPAAPLVETASPELVARVTAESFRQAGTAKAPLQSLYITAPSPTLPRLTAYAWRGGEDGKDFEADATGHVHSAEDARWTEFMRGHHHDFNLPDPFGDYLVGILGTLLIAGLLSGLLAHRRIIKDAFRLRWGGSPRRSNADLHNRIGVWAFPFHLIVSLTGSLLGLAGLIIGLLALIAYKGDTEKAIGALTGPQPIVDARPAALPDILPMVAAIEQRAPGSTIASLMIAKPGTRAQLVTIYTAAPGHLTRAEGWTFSGDGRMLAKAGLTDGNVGMRIYGMITPLHYGTYGGLPLKIIYVLLGGSLTTLVASGLTIWLARRREQGRPAPRRERLWAGLVWGQPLAFGMSALLSLAIALPPLPVFWLTTAVVALSCLFLDARRAAAWMRSAGALCIAALGVAHAAMRGDYLVLDAALLACSAALAAPAISPLVSRARTSAGARLAHR